MRSAGVTKDLIPKENMPNLKDALPEVKYKVEIMIVFKVAEVLKETGVQN